MEQKHSNTFKEDTLKRAEREVAKNASEKLGIDKHRIYEWRRTKRETKLLQPTEDDYERLRATVPQ